MTEFAKSILKDRPFKIELHSHTANVSKCSDIGGHELIKTYYSEGYKGVVLTNHFYPFAPKNQKKFDEYVDGYIKEYYRVREIGEEYGVKVYFGIEVTFSDNINDYLIYGVEPDFMKRIFTRDIKTFDAFYEKAQGEEFLLLQAHPFRRGMTLESAHIIDGIEVYNVHPNHNSSVGIAAKYAEEYPSYVCTCGTDFHHQGQGALSALLTSKIPEDSKELVKFIKEEPIYKIGNSILTF